MGWKSVEMQVALPRTQDASKLQNQMQQQSKHTQEHLADGQRITDQQKRKKVNENNQKDNVKNKKKEQGPASSSNEKRRQENMDDVILYHPYLGRQIDFNG